MTTSKIGFKHWPLLAACGLACALSSVATAQSALGNPDDDSGMAFQVKPELSISLEEHNFGEIDDSNPVKVKIAFANKGSGPLNISDVHATCGCTVPALAKKSYGPGEAGEIEVTFNPAHKKGPQQQTVTITSNDPVKPRREIVIKANVMPLVSVEPSVVQFGQVTKGTGAKQIVKVTGRLSNFSAQSITTSDPKILEAKVLKTESTKGPDGKEAFVSDIEIALAPSAPVGMVQHTATIRTSDPARIPNVTIVGEVIGDINVQPPRISLGAISLGAPISTDLKLTHRSNKPFEVVKVEEVTTDGQNRLKFETTADNAKKDSYTIKITGTGPSAAGGLKGDIVITTNIPGEESLKIPYYGFARAETQANPIQVPNPLGGKEVAPAPVKVVPQPTPAQPTKPN